MSESETTLAKSIRITEEETQYDAACKRILSEKVILANIMKGCLTEYRDCSVQEIAEQYIEGQPQVSNVPVEPDEEPPVIQGASNEDRSLTEGTVFYDIRFLAVAPGSGAHIRLIINVEAQGDFYPGYPLLMRAIYYCCRMISRQNGTEFTNSQYDKIRKVYSIWICTDPPKSLENTIRRYHMTEEHLFGHAEEPVEHYDLLSIIMVCLGSPNSKPDDRVLSLLNVLLSSKVPADEKKQILHNDFGIPMTKMLNKEVSAMCNLSQGVLKRGIQEGIQIGRQEGIQIGRQEALQEGIQIGRQEGLQEGIQIGRQEALQEEIQEGRQIVMEQALLSAVQRLMETTHWTAEQAMTALKIPPEKHNDYLKHLN